MTNSTAPITFYAPCPRGMEGLLADEIRAVGGDVIQTLHAGLRFRGDVAVGYQANLHSRIASRILEEVAAGPYRSEDDLYRMANDTPWERWNDAKATLRVDVNAVDSPLKSLQFATLRIKDGIVDRYRNKGGIRPDIDTYHPARRVMAFLTQGYCTLYLDWSGEPLFKRGWRKDGGEAPLKENLAAGLIRLSGWSPDQVLLDPFCGSGTIAIEAADIAFGQPPGVGRNFAFEQRLDFQRPLWKKLNEWKPAAAPGNVRIFGSDISEASIAFARENLKRSGIDASRVQFRQLDALNSEAPAASGIIVTNPPYGERLDMKGRQSMAEADVFWPAFGTVLKQQFAGWNACLFTSDLDVPGRMRLKEKRRTPLYNGPIECRLFRFEMYAGSRREKPAVEPA